MPKTAPNYLPTQQPLKPACSVCWEDFDQLPQLDDHIRTTHPDRIRTQEEFFAQRQIA
jgi:hypothetical protein